MEAKPKAEQVPKGPSLVHSAITSHLRRMGYPEKSISSMNRCGEKNGLILIKDCHCEIVPVEASHKCNLRTCKSCSKTRKRRIFGRFLPFFSKYKKDRMNYFQFITISPPNYEELGKGFEDIRKNFSKFIRRKYVKERIKAGFYVLETKQDSIGNWNIHIHAVIYGRWIDYRIRGECKECGQNLLKFDKEGGRYYCANKKCNSLNVKRKKGTLLGREWERSSGRNAHIYGERVRNMGGAVSYLTKYIAHNKDNFRDEMGMAEYIFNIRKKKLISAFGKFYKEKVKVRKMKYYCPVCGGEIKYIFDIEVSYMIKDKMRRPPDQKKCILEYCVN